ncbi:hypothetical protein ABZ208_24025 [Streptomyces sp. NPDC006208]|uniref:hypothetical protein n=1 Tax=Streptomyces sp. NPDC006208 TaxID=3156734 RepID=UPI0033B18308
MTPEDDDPVTFLFYAPQKAPRAWALDLSRLGQAMREAYTEVRYKIRQDATRHGEPYLSFWVATGDGVECEGTATAHGRDCITLVDATAGDAGRFLAWFRDTCLPSPDLIRFSSGYAVERGIDSDWRLPAEGDQARVADELRHHLTVVDGA